MAEDYSALRSTISKHAKELRQLAPDTMSHFYQLSQAASADGALNAKTKEFIALAVGIAQHCDGCIAFHIKNLKNLGATRAEIAEVLAMNVYMGGGPALMYAAKALEALEQLETGTAS